MKDIIIKSCYKVDVQISFIFYFFYINVFHCIWYMWISKYW